MSSVVSTVSPLGERVETNPWSRMDEPGIGRQVPTFEGRVVPKEAGRRGAVSGSVGPANGRAREHCAGKWPGTTGSTDGVGRHRGQGPHEQGGGDDLFPLRSFQGAWYAQTPSP